MLSDGLQVNGTELVSGLTAALPPSVSVSGGLSGDGDRFGRTYVMYGDTVESGAVVGVGFYGEALTVRCASRGGWDPFGPRRLVTASDHNVVFELDGQPILDIYRRYLGRHADGLPASGLLFPLAIQLPGAENEIVRTILGMDAERGSLTFAGDVPAGVSARLMKARADRLVDGAVRAAATCQGAGAGDVKFAVLISCVGRKLVLKQRVEEEVEGVRSALGDAPVLSGFYSYGEISPFSPAAPCELHNQTMTVTIMQEG